MVVNSLSFLLFFVVVFIVYYLPICVKNSKIRNGWLFLVSYFFYGVADWKMIPLLFSVTIVFFVLGLWLKSEMKKTHIRAASHITTFGVCLGAGLLVYFKYLNFFAESFAELINNIGFNVSWSTLNIVLPVGVSFFTFKLISYVIEIHREHIEPCSDLIEFGTYIAFFPTILSGPIDKPNKFIPQLRGVKNFNYDLAIDGLLQIVYGCFLKMCIADNLSLITDNVWENIENNSSATLLLTAIMYPIQMYADFDGYSHMAIGVGKLLGFKITRNFNHPFLARNIADYWRNWHISLTRWLTDYVFSPLNIKFRKFMKVGVIMAIIINFVIIGLWHGANWTFGLFGLYHGLLYVPLILQGEFGKVHKIQINRFGIPKIIELYKMMNTFFLVSIGLIIFRSSSITEMYLYFKNMLTASLFSSPEGKIAFIVYALPILILEWILRKREYLFDFLVNKKDVYIVCYLVLSTFVIYLLRGNVNKEFIYMQF